MFENIYDWSLLLGRWIHITTAICWIGTSIFFMWMDRSFKKISNTDDAHLGELWMVHGGGFYKVEKLKMGSIEVPPILHWFKWEAYWTWLSGVFLLYMLFYFDGGSELIDVDIYELTNLQAITIGIGTIFGSWIIYDLLWESRLSKKAYVAHFLTISYTAFVIYFLCHTFQSRAAYIHVAGMLGTWMAGNVLMRIIPRMKKMVKNSKENQPIDPSWAINAKNRSTHNTYFTLPIIFIMFSNHFPNVYGHSLNWVLLILLCISGAAIRHYFIIRLDTPTKAKIFGALGVLSIFLTMYISSWQS